MIIKKGQYPIVLALIENFGLSSSWSGNAIISGNPKNFYSLWQRYPHTAIYPNSKEATHSYENIGLDFAKISSGYEVLSNKKYTDLEIENQDFFQKQSFTKIFDEALDRNSALHLVGNLSGKNGKYSDINHLLAILKIAKRERLFRAYIHLIVDDDLLDYPELTSDLIKKIQDLGVGEIASVSGQKFVDDKNQNFKDFLNVMKTIVNGSGAQALSASQALNFGVKPPSQKAPTSVVFKNRYVCRVNNFDVVLFFNHNNKNLERLILAFASESGKFKRFKLPRFLKVSSLFNPFDQEIDSVDYLLERKFENTISRVFSQNKKRQLYIADASRMTRIKSYFQGSYESESLKKEQFVPCEHDGNPEKYRRVLDSFANTLEHYLSKNLADFIVLDVAGITHACKMGTFQDTITACSVIDSFLPKLENMVLASKGTLIVTSDHGGAEKLTDRNDYESLNEKTLNPVPFIVTTEKSSSEVSSDRTVIFNQMIYDMIKKKHFRRDIAPTILDLANLPIPDSMEGRSILEDLRI